MIAFVFTGLASFTDLGLEWMGDFSALPLRKASGA